MANERTSLYLPAETKQALAAYQERTKAENMSAAADELIQRGLGAASAHNVGALAAPAIEEAAWKGTPTSATTTGRRSASGSRRRPRSAPGQRPRPACWRA